jgi:hypothetical protein
MNFNDDDGQSLGYRDGSDLKMNWIRIHWNDRTRRLTLRSNGPIKPKSGASRVFAVEVIGSHAEPKRVEFKGAKVDVKL